MRKEIVATSALAAMLAAFSAPLTAGTEAMSEGAVKQGEGGAPFEDTEASGVLMQGGGGAPFDETEATGVVGATEQEGSADAADPAKLKTQEFMEDSASDAQ